MKFPSSLYAAESQRLKVSRMLQSDADLLFEMYSDAEAMKFRGSKPMTLLADAHQMIATQLVEVGTISRLRIGIRLKATELIIGTTLLTFDSLQPDQYEIGFSFGKQHWGQGYGLETLEMVEVVLQASKAARLKSYSLKENLASIRLLEKAGFVKTPQEKYPGSYLFTKELSLP